MDAVQLFDSWGGVLSRSIGNSFGPIHAPNRAELRDDIPTIVFAKDVGIPGRHGTWGANAWVDWTIRPEEARRRQPRRHPSRKLRPVRLMSPRPNPMDGQEMIDAFGKDRYVVNLGHGILPNIPSARAGVVEAVKPTPPAMNLTQRPRACAARACATSWPSTPCGARISSRRVCPRRAGWREIPSMPATSSEAST